MKNTLLTTMLLITAMLLGIVAQADQLSGAYTIDPGQPASATNFQDFQSAITFLTTTDSRNDGGDANTGTVGVSGPVVFWVAAGTYSITDGIRIPDVPGASPINTITFDGGAGNAANCVITGEIYGAVWVYDQCKYVSLRNLTLENTNENDGGGVVFYNTTSGTGTLAPGGSCNSISNCIVNVAYKWDGNCINAASYDYGTGYYNSCAADSLIIDSNVCNGGSYGIGVDGWYGPSYNRGIKIRNNKLNDTYQYGIYTTSLINQVDILNNEITMSPENGYMGIYIDAYYCCTVGVSPYKIIGNKINNYGGYGIYADYINGSASNPAQINNNSVTSTSTNQQYFGIYAYTFSGSYCEIINNTSVFPASGYNGYYIYGPLYYAGTTNAVIKNNIFANYSGGSTNAAYIGTSPTTGLVNYNNYYCVGTNLVYRNGQFSSSTYQTATAGGDSSYNEAPNFVNLAGGNVHLSDACGPKGPFFANVPTDIDGDPRNTPTTMVGADEATGQPNDMSVRAILSPVVPITTGLQDVVVRVKNIGTNSVSNFDISYIHNNGSPVTINWTGTLPSCGETTVTFTGANQVNLVSSNTIVVYTSSPNSSADANRSNDSAKTVLYAPLSGNYVIGSSLAANFSSFADAMTALSSGMSGPVNFTVEPGNYNENVTLNAPVGLSIANPLSFDGGDASTTSITSSSPFTLNQCKYVTVKNITFNANGQVGIAIVGTTSNNNGSCNTIKKCVVNMSNTYGYGIITSSSATSPNICHIDSTTIDSCTIYNTGYGIWMYGDYNTNTYACINNQITNTTINGAYQMGIYLSYTAGGVKVKNNTVIMSPYNTYSYGIYAYSNSYFSLGSIYVYKGPKVANEFTGNKVTAGYMGMYLNNLYGTVNNPTMITNNMVSVSGYAYYGIYMYNYQMYLSSSDPTPTCRIYHNTITLNTTNSGYGLYYYYYGNNGANDVKADIKNNIFYTVNQGYSAYIYSLTNAGTGFVPTLDYNIYYSATSANLLYLQGVLYNNTNYNLSSSGGANSVSVKPPFVSASDLHLNNACYRGVDLTAWVSKDIDGDTRSTTPNMGADEYPGLALDVSVEAVVSPVFPIQAGANDLKVRVRNNGYSILNSFSLTYVLNGGTPVTNVWTGSFNPCDTMIVTFTGTEQVNIPDGSNNLVVYSSNPNASADMNPSNDMLNIALSTPMAGDYVIGTPPSDYPNFTSAANDLAVRGIKGHVRFHAKTGTYNENVAINGVIGSADTCTILFHSIAENPDSVKIIASADYVFNLKNVNYTSFRNLTLNQSSYSSGGGVLSLSGTCNNVSVTGCKFIQPTGYTGNHVYAYPANINNFELARNSFVGGSYWIQQQSSNNNISFPAQFSSLRIDSNTVKQVYYLMNSYYTKDMKIRYNDITLDDISTYTFMQIFYPYCVNSNYEFSNNKLVRLQSSTTYNYNFYFYPFYMCNYNLPTAPTMNAKVMNNIINLNAPSSNGYMYGGTYTYYANWTDYGNNKLIIQDDPYGNSQFYVNWYYTKYFNVFNSTFPLGATNFYWYPYNSPGNKFINNTVTSKYQYYYGMYLYGPSTDMVFKNNILVNNSSSYAPIYISSNPAATSTWDYNNYYNQQSSGPIVNGSYTIPSWETTSGKDRNSLSYDPALLNWNYNLVPDINNPSAWSVNGRGMPDSMVTNDLAGASRSIVVATGATDLGAYEITPSTTPPNAVATPSSPAAGTTQVFTFGQDTVATIAWDQFAVIPSSITVQLYSGTNPPAVLGGNMMNAYWDVQASGNSNYALSLYHKGNMVGNNPDKSALIGAQHTSSWAFVYTSTSDVNNNILNITGLSTFGQFTGTDQNSPFTGLTPPVFFGLHAKNLGVDVGVNWNDESSKLLVNKGRYVVERSFDGTNYVAVGDVKITGDYSYNFIDQGAISKAPGMTIYYRLRTVGNDGVEMSNGTTEYSKVALVNLDDQAGVYPNPFSSSVSVNVTMIKGGEVKLNVKDISGRVLVSQSKTASMGNTTVNVDQLSDLKPGVYFLTVDAEGTSQVYKIIKN